MLSVRHMTGLAVRKTSYQYSSKYFQGGHVRSLYNRKNPRWGRRMRGQQHVRKTLSTHTPAFPNNDNSEETVGRADSIRRVATIAKPEMPLILKNPWT